MIGLVSGSATLEKIGASSRNIKFPHRLTGASNDVFRLVAGAYYDLNLTTTLARATAPLTLITSPSRRERDA